MALCLVALCAAPAMAGTPGIDAEQFHPAITGDSFFGVDGAFVVPHLTLTGGAWLNYAHAPLIVERGGKSSDVIASQLGLDLALTIGILDRLEIGILLPATFNAQHDNSILDLKGGLDGAGLGDLTLDLKGTLLDAHAHGHRIGLAVAVAVSAPTGDAANFSSQGGWTGRPRVAFEWRAPHNSVGIGLTVGAVLRSERDLGQLSVTHQISYGLGLRVNATHGLFALAEVRGLAGVALPSSVNFSTAEAPLEADLGLRWRSKFGLQLEVAGGFGLTRGYGTPDGRLIAGIRYYAALARKRVEPAVVDRDADGVPDEVDRCPNLAGPPANHGCPVADLDGDGVDDSLDKCPNERGPVENHGCPEFDSDQDGVPDRLDKCPELPGPKEKQGCPDDDRDHDGIPDAKDRCPDQPGAAGNDGCPDVDSDGDGIVDRLDKCPFDPETFNGVADDDGCPDPGPVLAELQEDRIVIKEPIVFGSKNRIEVRSHRVLGVVAKLLELHPEIRKVRIEGHTDDRGSAIDNLDLSRERAAAVRRHLIDIDGIDGKRLVAQGFGPDRPIADNKTEAGRAKNRRIEFVIIEKAPAP